MLGRRQKPMKRASKSLCAQKRAQRRAYAAADDAEQAWCSACGKPGPTDHAHLFTQGRWEQHRNTAQNWKRLCRKCHRLQEDNKAAFATQYPQLWAEMLAQMQAVDPQAFAQFGLNNSHLLPAALLG